MKKEFKFLAIGAASFALGLSLNNFATSTVPTTFNVAVVDVPKVVASSARVSELKIEQKSDIEELSKFVDTAKATLAKEKNPTKRNALEGKYSKEFNAKKDAIDKDYAKRLSAIQQNISSVIKDKAASQNYDLVLDKGAVLVGGTDITSEIAKEVK